MKTFSRLLALFLSLSLVLSLLSVSVQAGNPVSSAEETRGVWIASTYNIDFPKKQGSDVAQMKKELDDIVETASKTGLNSIFFQVRPTGDALYTSSIFPWSNVLTGTQGKAPPDGFDPLAYLIESAKKKNIAVHAWVNPYRVAQGSPTSPAKIEDLSPENPARKNPAMLKSYADGKLYLNPGNPDAMKLVLDGVAELVKNYDIAGVQFDDYFYPSTTVTENGKNVIAKFDDDAEYAAYGAGLSREDWRRKNVDTLVQKTAETVHNIKPDCKFGISPSGIWRNSSSDALGSATSGVESYDRYFADTRKWVKNEWIDYIAPQLYWYMGQKGSDFTVLCKWWADVCKGTSVDLLIGHAAYKLDSTNEWKNEEEIPAQVAMARDMGAKGSIFYGYSNIKNNVRNIQTLLSSLYQNSIPTPEPPVNPEPPTGEIRPLTIALPSYTSYKFSGNNIYLLGTADPRYPVYLNGEELPRTPSGHFSAYRTVAKEGSTFTFIFMDTKKVIKVGKDVVNAGGVSIPYVMDSPGFKVGSLTPSSGQLLTPGKTITLSCVAPSGVSVNAKIGDTVVALKEGKKEPNSGGLQTSLYSITYRVPDFHRAGITHLGRVEYGFVKDGKTYEGTSGGPVSVYGDANLEVATVREAEAVARTGPSSSYTKLPPLTKGVTDYVLMRDGAYSMLRSGQWVLTSTLSTSERLLPTNTIRRADLSLDNATTNLRFSMNYFAPYKTYSDDKKFVIRFYDTVGGPAPKIPENHPLFAWSTFTQEGEDAIYTFYLEEAGAFIGYLANQTGNSVVFTIKNPKGIAAGEKPLIGKTIVLDAGHGGTDIGAVGPVGPFFGTESALNLSLTFALRDKLSALGAKVILTRETNVTMSLDDRALFIKGKNPDFAISLHHNSLDISSNIANVDGHLVLYREEFSKTAAAAVSDAMGEKLSDRRNRGTNQQGLAVCYIMECPSILVEMGFIANPSEYEKLSSTFGAEADAIAAGVVNFFREH